MHLKLEGVQQQRQLYEADPNTQVFDKKLMLRSFSILNVAKSDPLVKPRYWNFLLK